MEHIDGFVIAEMEAEEMTLEEELNSTIKCHEWTIEDIHRKLNEENSVIYSELFQLPGYPFSAKVRMTYGYFIDLQLFDPAKINGPIVIRPMPKVTYIFKDQSENKEKRDFICSAHCLFRESIEYEQVLYGIGISEPLLKIKNNCVTIQISIESPSISQSFSSNTGEISWRVNNYSRKLQMIGVLKDYLESPYFYTAPTGYRVSMELSLNKSKYPRVYFNFLSGAHDALLPGEFRHEVTIILINQDDEEKNIKKCVKWNQTSYAEVMLGGSAAMESDGFVKDDSLLLKVKIKASD